jgi:hypothetical protein
MMKADRLLLNGTTTRKNQDQRAKLGFTKPNIDPVGGGEPPPLDLIRRNRGGAANTDHPPKKHYVRKRTHTTGNPRSHEYYISMQELRR